MTTHSNMITSPLSLWLDIVPIYTKHIITTGQNVIQPWSTIIAIVMTYFQNLALQGN
jgi:hypothetical protein